jgi:hypothetical protein
MKEVVEIFSKLKDAWYDETMGERQHKLYWLFQAIRKKL